jgi:hypothetical protein
MVDVKELVKKRNNIGQTIRERALKGKDAYDLVVEFNKLTQELIDNGRNVYLGSEWFKLENWGWKNGVRVYIGGTQAVKSNQVVEKREGYDKNTIYIKNNEEVEKKECYNVYMVGSGEFKQRQFIIDYLAENDIKEVFEDNYCSNGRNEYEFQFESFVEKDKLNVIINACQKMIMLIKNELDNALEAEIYIKKSKHFA